MASFRYRMDNPKAAIRSLLLIGLFAIGAGCDAGSCEDFTFNGLNDESAIAELEAFLSKSLGDCNDVSIMTKIKSTTETELTANEPTPADITTPAASTASSNHATTEPTAEVTSATTPTSTNGSAIDSTIRTVGTVNAVTMTAAATITPLIGITLNNQKTTSLAPNATPNPWLGWKKSGGRYYKCFTDARLNYRDARENCSAAYPGGRLAAEVLRNPVAVADIGSRCVDQLKYSLWIGYDALGNDDEWIWSDGGSTDQSTTTWAEGEPNNSEIEHCAHIAQFVNSRLELHDYGCHRNLTYVCEI